MMDAAGLLDFSTWLQHWTGPVEQELGGGEPEGFDLFASVRVGDRCQLALTFRGTWQTGFAEHPCARAL